jgi:hypothetical protein
MTRLYYNNKEVRTPSRTKLFINICHVCQKQFETYRKTKKTCSMDCKRQIAKPAIKGENRNCAKCNKIFWARPSDDRRGSIRKYCSRQCSRKYSDRPAGAYISYDGYWCISPDKKLHRDIYEKHFKIKLKSDDIIHHINEDKLDNRIENLQKMTRTEHNKLHKFLKINRTDLYSAKEIKDLFKLTAEEFVIKHPHRTIRAVLKKKRELNKKNKLA